MYKSIFIASAVLALAQAWQECGKHEIQVYGKCECKLGYVRFHDKCTRCPYDSKFSCKAKTCICQQDKVYDAVANICKQKHIEKTEKETTHKYDVSTTHEPESYHSYHSHHDYGYCGDNQVYSYGGCVCKQGFTKYDGYNCIRNCPYNGHWQVSANSCVCNFGLKWDHYQTQCVPDCKKNEIFTPGGGCTCKQGFNKYDGVNCIKCPSRSYWQNGCVCEWGLQLKGDECVPKHKY